MAMQQQQMQQQYETERARNMMADMTMPSRGPDGLRPYDPMTAPQPNAFNYRISEDDPYFPNKKWNCGDTDCCNERQRQPVLPPPPQAQKCEESPCVEPAAPGPSPNAVYSIKRLIM